MRIETTTSPKARQNTFAFSQEACDTVRATVVAKAEANGEEPLVHKHTAQSCYTRTTDWHMVTLFFGIEDIDDVPYKVTGNELASDAVVEPSEIEKGQLIGETVLLEHLDRIDRKASLVPGQPETLGRLQGDANRIRAMLP